MLRVGAPQKVELPGIREKVHEGVRLSLDDGLTLFESNDVTGIGRPAKRTTLYDRGLEPGVSVEDV